MDNVFGGESAHIGSGKVPVETTDTYSGTVWFGG
jgi:hypothetical protein